MIDGVEIDWKTAPQLKRRRNHDPRDRERLAESKMRRRKKKPSKAHSTEPERATRRIKLEEQKKRALEKREAYFAYDNQVKAYWRGERPDHP